MEKINFEQFIKAVQKDNQPFIKELNDYLLDNDCKVTFEEKKSGYLASYKHGKVKKALINILFRKSGMLIRIYGENADKYLDILNTLPEEMVESIDKAGICNRIVNNTCSPKCSGYDVTIKNKRYQKCRYGAFEFLVNEKSSPFIKSFIESEIKERTN